MDCAAIFLPCQTLLHNVSKKFTFFEFAISLNLLACNILNVLARFWHVLLQKQLLIYEKNIYNNCNFRFRSSCHSADNDDGRVYGIRRGALCYGGETGE